MSTERNKEKTLMLFHRSYRKLPGSFLISLIQFVLLAVPFSVLTLFFYPDFTLAMCRGVGYVIAAELPQAMVQISTTPFIDSIGNISFLYLSGGHPTFYFSLANAIVCLLLLLILLNMKSSLPSVIFLIIIASIHLISSLFFVFVPDRFPYEVVDYSRLYMLQEISIWFFTPLIMGFGIMPLPSTLAAKIVTIAITYIYSLLFGFIRYTVFLYILAKASLIYMALLFFAFGPLIDFVYIVGIYSFHVARLAHRIKDDYRLWKWQYLS